VTRSPRPTRAHALRPAVESLADRTLPSASVTAALADGVLRVLGTAADDRITISLVQNRVILRTLGERAAIEVAGVGRFPLSAVRSIEVAAGAGNDRITLNVARKGLSVVLDGGAGDDTIRGSASAETIRGGAGNDTILGRGGRDTIDPGPGTNRVNGRKVVVNDSSPLSPTAPAPAAPSPSAPKPPYTVLPTSPTPALDISGWGDRLATLVNAERAQRGLGVLAYNTQLEQIARIQVDQMVQFGLMQHELPGAQYPDMRGRADAVGYQLEWLGENLAYNYPDPEGVIQGWMFSQGHRDNLLFAPYTEMGLAVRLDQWGRVYVALEMGRPLGG
jgi:uncharacterized protein YkwD